MTGDHEEQRQPEKAEPSYVPPQAALDPRGPLAAVVIIGVFLCMTATSRKVNDSVLPFTLDPTGNLGPGSWFCLYLLTIPAKEIVNHGLKVLASSYLQIERMDPPTEKVKKLESLATVDYCYLALNTLVEFIGMNHVYATITDDSMSWRLLDFTLTSGPVAFVLIMMANDIIYYPFHYIAHSRTFYPYWHKQHHRNLVPFRGYGDAANQHPIEQCYGFCIFMASVTLVNQFVGMHGVAAWSAALVWAVLNIANHLPYNSEIHLPLPFPAYPRDHQMHHRFQKCNYSTLTTLCDRLFGTFREFKALDAVDPPPPPKKMWYELSHDPAAPPEEDGWMSKVGRPDLFPSPWSICGLMVFMLLVGIVLDGVDQREIPAWNDALTYSKSIIVAFNLALLIRAVEHACSKEIEPKGKKTRVYTKPRMAEAEPKEPRFKEAVPTGHHKKFVGGKGVFKPKLSDAISAKVERRELKKDL